MNGDIGTLTTDSSLNIVGNDISTAIKVDAADTIASSWPICHRTAAEARQCYLENVVDGGEKCIQESLEYPLLKEEREFLETSLKLIKIKEKLNKLNTWVTK